MRSPETRCTGPLLIYVTDSELPEEPQAGQPPGPPLTPRSTGDGGRGAARLRGGTSLKRLPRVLYIPGRARQPKAEPPSLRKR